MTNETDAQAILDAGSKLANIGTRITTLAHPENDRVSIPVAIEPKDGSLKVEVMASTLKELDSRLPGPRRRVCVRRMTEADSFIAACLRWGSAAQAVIYADTSAMAFTAVLDEHPVGTGTAWRDDRVSYVCPRSEEWKAWTANEGRAMDQVAFGDFLESRFEDMTTGPSTPTPPDMLLMARKLLIKTKGTIQREIDPTTGDNIMVNKSETDTGSTVIPRAFLIAIPVFEGDQSYQLECRVRFAVVDGKPAFTYLIHRRAEAERDAFVGVRTKIAQQTAFPLLIGTP